MINSLIINPCFIEVDLGHSATHTFLQNLFSRTPLSLAAVSESWQGPVFDGFVVLGAAMTIIELQVFQKNEFLDFGLYNLFVEESKSEFDNTCSVLRFFGQCKFPLVLVAPMHM